MFRALWKSLSQEISGPMAFQTVVDISRFHRIQASPGYRRAAELVYESLCEAGLQASILTYPADQETMFWSSTSFQEWDAHQATLHLIEPSEKARKLADYRELPLSLVARSLSFDGDAQVVVLDQGTSSEEYEGLDLEGKIVLAKGNVRHVRDQAIVQRGALGLLYDGMWEVEPVRPAWSLADATQYTSFWWQGEEPKGFGFALSPREGERIRRLAKEHDLRVQAKVDARLYDGSLEVVEASIPGTTDDEIVLVAHLCHPQPSANDNASGAAALLEVARALAALIKRGELKAPRRTIRFLWVPEMTGTFTYLSTREDQIPHMVAGLNLDMVGQDQEQCGSSLLIEQPPHALPSYTGVLLSCLRENLLPEVRTHGQLGGYPLFRYADTPFSGGSDHYIFSDPSVGVPMPMIIQWPDRFYHTSADTPGRVDPQMLVRVGCLTAAYAYWLAQADKPEARWLAREVSSHYRQSIIRECQAAVTHTYGEDGISAEEFNEHLEYLTKRHTLMLESIRRLADVNVSKQQAIDHEFTTSERKSVTDLLSDQVPSPTPPIDGASMIPLRLFRGPAQTGAAVARLDLEDQLRFASLQEKIGKTSRTLPVLAEYWADGKRNLSEIGSLVRQETGQEATELMVEYFGALAELNLVEMREKSD